jgi:hypothetical protein
LPALLSTAVFSVAPSATAQQYLLGAGGEIQSGVAAGGPGARMVRRARTTLRLSVDVRNDELPNDAISGALVAELEPRAALGGDLHYMRLLSPKIAVAAGGIAFVAPKTLLGASAFASYRLPLGGLRLTTGPGFQIFFAGQDLPTPVPIWQATWRLGFHVDL